MHDQPKVAVIGAGAVGLTVAKILQERLDKVKITVIANNYTKDTVSHVAAGIFRPGTSFKGPKEGKAKQWIDDSWRYWQEILRSPDAPEAGIMDLSAYIFSSENYETTRNHFLEELVPIYRPVTDKELRLGPEGTKFGSFFDTLKVECERYLPWTGKLITEKGAQMIKRKIDSFSALSGYDLVFNCSGLGAKQLCNDYELVPIRGQILKVKAPWVKTAFYWDYDTYIIPGLNGIVTLGGTRQYDSYNLKFCKYDAASIKERCFELLPSLKNAKVVDELVGLRPHRSPVRVEPEIIDGLKVVHCYGHGGYGVMTAPGTAKDAVDIGVDFLKSNIKHKL